jgi:hypothetical protein
MADFKFVIYRKYEELETLGYAVILSNDEKVFKFNTIELPLFIVPLKPNTVCTNCIPEGTYKVTKIYSPTKGQCFMVHDVMGRTAILIHKGNYAHGKKVDTQGCILVGDGFEDINKDGELDVIHSTETLTQLLSILPNEFKLIVF